jgi:hypothetical protein
MTSIIAYTTNEPVSLLQMDTHFIVHGWKSHTAAVPYFNHICTSACEHNIHKATTMWSNNNEGFGKEENVLTQRTFTSKFYENKVGIGDVLSESIVEPRVT